MLKESSTSSLASINSTNKKVALITGITGQDGAYLARLLLNKENYEVHGLVRRNSTPNKQRLDQFGITDKITFHDADLTEHETVNRIIESIFPDEIYNLGAMSFVASSFNNPLYTAQVNGLAVLNMLTFISKNFPECRFYQASTSEMFGDVLEIPQTEKTPFNPRSPYGSAKAFAHHTCVNFRHAYGMHISCGILFNHESFLRGKEFVTRKIARGLTKIFNEIKVTNSSQQVTNVLHLGNVHAKRDWGHAEDYVNAMWLMLQQEEPDDYVIATGESHTIEEFIHACMDWGIRKNLISPCVYSGFGTSWTASINPYYLNKGAENVIIKIDPQFYRPSEVNHLQGDASKAREKLGWVPVKSDLLSLVKDMMEAEDERVKSNGP